MSVRFSRHFGRLVLVSFGLVLGWFWGVLVGFGGLGVLGWFWVGLGWFGCFGCVYVGGC